MTRQRSLILAMALAVFLCATGGLMLGRQKVLTPTPLEPSPTSLVTSPPQAEGGGRSASRSSLAEPQPDTGENTPFSDNDGAKRRWEPTAESFAKNFTNVHDGKHAWSARLLPFVTEKVGSYLATVDISNVPTGRYREYEILEPGESELTIRVTYREGWSIVLYLITDGTDWKVYRYDRFAG